VVHETVGFVRAEENFGNSWLVTRRSKKLVFPWKDGITFFSRFETALGYSW
jgi:hypothetical protein